MPLIILPSPRLAFLRAFWLTLCAEIWLAAIFLFRMAGIFHYFVLASLLIIVLVLFGFCWPQLLANSYRCWNRFAERYARCSKTILLLICYYLVFTATGLAGSEMIHDRKRNSLWVSRTKRFPDNDVYASQADGLIHGSARNWIMSYIRWAYESGNFHAVSLLPYLLLVAALETERSGDISTSIYTLF
jgi:hypothetical protein